MIDVDSAPAAAFGLAEDLTDVTSPWHSHRMHQVLYAVSGTMHLTAEGAQWLLPPQRAAWISAGISHRVQARAIALRTVYLAPALVPAPAGGCCVFPVEPLAREMLLYATRWGPARPPGDPVAEPFFLTLAGLCSGWAAQSLPWRLPVAETPELALAMAYALSELGGQPTLEEAARAAGLSPRTLARRFQAEAATSWRAFLGDARMLKAMEILAAPGARVTDAALDVGFESLGAFTRAFQRFTGELPSAYRRRVGVT